MASYDLPQNLDGRLVSQQELEVRKNSGKNRGVFKTG